MKANKRRIRIINLWKVPKWTLLDQRGQPRRLSREGDEVPRNPIVKQGKAKLAFGQRFHDELEGGPAADVQIEAVHEEKRVSRGKSHPLVAIEKRLVID